MAKGPPPPLKPKPKVPPPLAAKKPNVEILVSSSIHSKVSKTGYEEPTTSQLRDGLGNINISPPSINNKRPEKIKPAEIESVITKPIILTSIDDSGSDGKADFKNEKPFGAPTTARFPPPPKRNISHTKPHFKAEECEDPMSANANAPPVNRRSHETTFKKDIDSPQRLASFYNDKKSDTEYNSNTGSEESFENPPVLPTRPRSREPELRQIPKFKILDDDSEAPKLPTRPPRSNKIESTDDKNRPSFLSPKKPLETNVKKLRESNLDFETLSFDRHDRPHKPSVKPRNYGRPISSHKESNTFDDSDEEVSELSSTDKLENAGTHASQMFDTAKNVSKAGYSSTVERTAPLANHAKHSINKWKDKISNSTTSLPEVDNTGDTYYQLRAERAKAARSQSPRTLVSENDNNNTDSTDNVDAYDPDVSIDEDRPPLPKRKSVYSRPVKSPPPVASKAKAKIESSRITNPVVPPKRSFLSADTLTKSQSPRLVTPPPVVSRSTPPLVPPVRGSPVPSVHEKPIAPLPRAKASIPVAPPSRKSNNLSNVSTNAKWREPELDLEFPSLWFVDPNELRLPECLNGLNYQMSAGFAANKEFRIYVLRGKDLSTIRLKITWNKDGQEPLATLSHELKFTPPPVPTTDLLINGHNKFGEHVANWCEVKTGKTVGNGECWTLAHDALQKGCGKHAFVSTGLVHGALLYTVKTMNDEPAVVIPNITDDVKRGDILQFKSCFFKYPNCTMTYGTPDHTAVVLDVKDGFKGGLLKELSIIQQNFNGDKMVSEATIDLGRLKGGDIKVYRPVDSDWVVDLADCIL